MGAVLRILEKHPKVIIFYNFDYELEILRGLVSAKSEQLFVGELNGHRKTPIPEGDRWVYLVQYAAGAEAWNCTTTNAMIFYSLNYSFKNGRQARGRIDRLDTPFTDLFYYTLRSKSVIDLAIYNTTQRKKLFNERVWAAENL
jgi:hypothetical protein